jgi:hypothetical protein
MPHNVNYHNYRLFVPKQATGANLVYFDFFNAVGSNQLIRISSIVPVVSGAVAVVGTLGVDLFLTRTTAVGTGGTAATRNGTDITAMTISKVNSKLTEINGLVTARLTPTGGATAGPVLSMASVFTEETTAASYTANLFDFVAFGKDPESVCLNEGEGIRIVQGAVASVGNIAFNVLFAADSR